VKDRGAGLGGYPLRTPPNAKFVEWLRFVESLTRTRCLLGYWWSGQTSCQSRNAGSTSITQAGPGDSAPGDRGQRGGARSAR